jgi:hypothetical protein
METAAAAGAVEGHEGCSRLYALRDSAGKFARIVLSQGIFPG